MKKNKLCPRFLFNLAFYHKILYIKPYGKHGIISAPIENKSITSDQISYRSFAMYLTLLLTQSKVL